MSAITILSGHVGWVWTKGFPQPCGTARVAEPGGKGDTDLAGDHRLQRIKRTSAISLRHLVRHNRAQAGRAAVEGGRDAYASRRGSRVAALCRENKRRRV